MKKHLYNFFINSLPFIVSLIPSIIAIPFYLKYVGEKQLGVYYLYLTLVGIGSAFDLGISQTLIKYISYYKGKSNYFVSQIIESSRSVLYVLVIVCAFLFTFYEVFELIFNKSFNGTLSLVFFVGFLIQFVVNFELAILRGFERFNSVAYYEIAQKLIFTLLGILLVYYFKDVKFLLLAHLSVTLVVLTIVSFKNKVVISKQARFLKIKIGFFKRFLFNYSKWVFVQNLIGFLNGNVDKFIVASYVNVGALASYSTSQNLTGLFQGFLSKGLAYLLPYASKLDDKEELRQFFIRGNFILSTILGLVYVCSSILAPTVITWYLKSDPQVAFLVIKYFDILLISSLFSCTSLFSWHMFNGMGEIKTNTTIPLYFNVLSIILMLVFGYYHGVWGILYAKLISITFSVVVRTISYNKIFNRKDYLIGVKLALPLIFLILIVEIIHPKIF